MELLQLTYFCDAAETENFSKTAKKFNVPASNISQSIHRLENELEATLFDRSANKITLNERGRTLYKSTKEALSLIKSAKEKICDKNEISGEIQILGETNRSVVTNAVKSFQEKYKEVNFYINHSLDDYSDKYDFIVTDKILANKNFAKKLLVVDDILLAIEKTNPLLKKKKLTVKDLEGERFITMSAHSSICKITNEICEENGFTPNIVIHSDDPYYIRKYVEMGMGISFFPSLSWSGMFTKDVETRKVVDYKRYTYVYYNKGKYMSRAAELFLSFLTYTSNSCGE